MPKGRMRLTRSLTSGLTRAASDHEGEFWGVGDRGPNLKPKVAVKRYGLTVLEPFAKLDGAKVMPLPGEGPCLARFRIDGDGISLIALARLHGPSGEALSGLPPPSDPALESEPALALDGTRLGCAADGADTEGIAALPNGRFWIAEEYGPSLLLVDREGQVQRRVVPRGTEGYFAGAQVPIDPALPALAAARKLNRGFEGLALSPDGALLYAVFQSPLAHPDRAAHEGADLVRLWALDPQSGELRNEYAYPLDQPENFRRDCAEGKVEPGDVKVSELASLTDGSLLVLERVTLSTKFYRVRPAESPSLPAVFADPAHRPTLEQIGHAKAMATGIPVLAKELVFDTDNRPEIDGDLEGLIVLGPDTLLIANDSDYGTEGAETRFWRVTLPPGTLG